jgi:hypothetical protein
MRIVSTRNTEYLLRSDGSCVGARRRGAEAFLTSHPAVGRVAVPHGPPSTGYVAGGRLYLMGLYDVLLTTEITVTEEVGDEVLDLLDSESGVRFSPTGTLVSGGARREG